MARGKTQMTAFSRFLIFLLIATPLIFFGVSYYKGEDPIQTIKEMAGSKSVPVEEVAVPSTGSTSETEVNSELARLRDKMSFTEKRNTDLYRENEELKAQLKLKEEELVAVKAQLEKIKSAFGNE